MPPDNGMTDEWIRKDLKGSSNCLIELLSQHLHGGTDENNEKTSIKIAGVLAKIQTEHLLDTSLEHYL
jgi:hypothetical protein